MRLWARLVTDGHIEKQFVRLFVGRTVVVGIEFVRPHVLFPGIHSVGIVPGSVFGELCDLGVGDGHELDMAKALDLYITKIKNGEEVAEVEVHSDEAKEEFIRTQQSKLAKKGRTRSTSSADKK